MKAFLKSALFKLSIMALCGVAPTACAENKSLPLPHIFNGNEVPADVMNEPRLVTTALPNASNHAAWPRLGDVPAKPTNFTTMPLIDQTKLEMENDRVSAEQKREDIENPPLLVAPPMAY